MRINKLPTNTQYECTVKPPLDSPYPTEYTQITCKMNNECNLAKTAESKKKLLPFFYNFPRTVKKLTGIFK